MSLPDCVFGQRWLVSCGVLGPATKGGYGISVLALPERMVIWELNVWTDGFITSLERVFMGLGAEVPQDFAEAGLLESVPAGLGRWNGEWFEVNLPFYMSVDFRRLRTVIVTGGRRLVLMVETGFLKTGWVQAAMVVSGVPKEVPEWAISARAKNLLR